MDLSQLGNRIIANEGRKVILDTNLLIPLILSNLMPDWRRHKTTKNFLPTDLEVIKGCIEYFGEVVTTPHILTEVCNHLDDTSALLEIRKFIKLAHEVTYASAELSSDSLFSFYGLADVALITSASRPLNTILFSTDEEHCKSSN